MHHQIGELVTEYRAKYKAINLNRDSRFLKKGYFVHYYVIRTLDTFQDFNIICLQYKRARVHTQHLYISM